MPNCFYLILGVKLARRNGQSYEKLNHFFSVFIRLSPFSACFLAGKGVAYVRIAQNNKIVICSYVANCYFFIL